MTDQASPGYRAASRERRTVGLAAGLVFFAAIMMTGRTWARAVAIMLALISAIVTLGFVPYYPLWALIIIALDVAAVWAVAAYGRDALNADRNERKGQLPWPRPPRWERAGVPHGGWVAAVSDT
jgi:uncharacterized membrane protein YccC